MTTCPFSNIAELESIAFEHIRSGTRAGAGSVIELRDSFCNRPPDLVRLGEDELRRIATPPLTWHPGFPLQTPAPGGRAAPHYHADLDHGAIGLHIDYFRFVRHGPLLGIEGFAVSRGGEILAVGGHWGMPLGGGRKHWPLALNLEPGLLCIYEPFWCSPGGFRLAGLWIWEKQAT